MNVCSSASAKQDGRLRARGILRGEYGQLPGKANEEVRKKCIGDDKVTTCRPADLIEPELEKYRASSAAARRARRDVPPYALFPSVATKFFGVARESA